MAKIAFSLLLSFVATCFATHSQDVLDTAPRVWHSNRTCAVADNALNRAWRGCYKGQCACTHKYLQVTANYSLCHSKGDDESRASVQYYLNGLANLCRFRGYKTDGIQLSLSPAARSLVEARNNQDKELRRKQTAFLALQIAGGVGLVCLVLFAIISLKIRRDLIAFNFCVTWLFSSVVFSLLLYRGTEASTTSAPLPASMDFHSLCLAQAALTSGVQLMTASSTFALVVELWFSFRAAIRGTEGLKQNKRLRIALLLAPYIFLVAFSLPAVLPINGLTPTGVPGRFYCMLQKGTSFLLTVYGLMLAILILTIAFDAYTIAILYRHWRTFRSVQFKGPVLLSVLVRVTIFSVYRIAVAVAYGVVLAKRAGVTVLFPSNGLGGISWLNDPFVIPVWVDMLQAAIPLVAFIVFGSNSDFIHALMFWRNKSPVVLEIAPSDRAIIGNIPVTREEQVRPEGDAT